MANKTVEQIDIVAQIIAEMDEDQRIWSETVQVGDFVDGYGDKYYTFSNHQYETKGKLYEVREVDIRKDRETGKVYSRTVIVDGDYQDPSNPQKEKIWLSSGKVIYRNGVQIWESSLIKAVKVTLAGDEVLTAEERQKLEDMLFKPIGDKNAN